MPDETPPEPGTPGAQSVDLSNLPSDHPLVKAYAATKADLAKARQKIQGIEDEGKTELQRLTDQVAALSTDAAKAQAEAARFQVALEKKLTPTQAKRLVGSTPEELAADADALLADLGISPTGGTPDGGDTTSGADPAPGNRQEHLAGGIDPTHQSTSSADIRAAVDAAMSGRN